MKNKIHLYVDTRDTLDLRVQIPLNLKVKECRKTCHVNNDNKRSIVAILISGNIYFKAKNVL